MLQAVNSKPIETKAPKAEAKANAKSAAKDLESQLEGADFNSELEAASMGEEQTDLEVKPVKVSAEQALQTPSELIKLPGSEANNEGINPKVFDPALTRGVDKIIQPQTTDVAVPQLTNEQVMQLANAENLSPEAKAELMQAMLKTPQVQVGRSPALELAKTEVDPQLMNLEDFVSQKNAAMKRNLNNANAYGMPQKNQAGKAGMEHGLKSTQTINELLPTEQGTSQGMNSQQFILNNQADLGNQLKLNETQAPVKTFNMSNIKTDNPNQIMSQITDYIVQAKAAKEPTVNLRMNHDQLGMIDITVNKLGGNTDAIAINIGAHSVDGKNFFLANSKDLFSHLTSTGLNVSDLKVESSSQTAKNDFDFGGQSGRGSSSQDRQFGSEQNQRRHESERRQDLWKLLNQEAA